MIGVPLLERIRPWFFNYGFAIKELRTYALFWCRIPCVPMVWLTHIMRIELTIILTMLDVVCFK